MRIDLPQQSTSWSALAAIPVPSETRGPVTHRIYGTPRKLLGTFQAQSNRMGVDSPQATVQNQRNRANSSVGEHLPYKQGVRGSKPLSPTTDKHHVPTLLAPHSFEARTRVPH
jgi:hypothetical protein